MLVLSADARRALLAALANDRSAHVAVESAAAVHLGRGFALPLLVYGREGSSSALVRILESTAPRGSIVRDGLRIASLEATIVELCTRPTRALAAPLVAELLRAGSALEGRAVEPDVLVRLARRSGTASARRRLAYLLARAGHAEHGRALLPSERSGVIKLDPLGPLGGPLHGPTRVRVGVADGFPDADPAFASFVHAVLGESLDEVAALTSLGFPLSTAPPGALERGFFRQGPEGWIACEPVDEICRRVAAATSPARLRRLVKRLLAQDEPRARVDAALLEPDLERAATILDAQDLSRLVDVPRAQAVVARLAPHLAPRTLRPFLERTGRLADAARLLQSELRDARGPARARTLLAAAQVAWRRARPREAHARLGELSRDRLDPATSIDALLLRAALAAEAGAHPRARRHLEAALRKAERSGRELDRARALHRLGTIDARRGRPSEASAAYRAALDALGEGSPEERALTGILQSNLALTASWLGRFEEAESLARAALETKRAAGTWAEVVSTKVLLQRIQRAQGTPSPPGGRVPPLLEEAVRTGDPRLRLRVEVHLDLAEELAREDQLAAAERALEGARAALTALDGSEPILDAAFAHVDGLVQGLLGNLELGRARILEGTRAFERVEGVYWAARARRDAAGLADRAGRSDEALDLLAQVADACRTHRLVLGEDARHVAVWTLGALGGDERLRVHAERVLGGLGAIAVRRELVAQGLVARADALAARTRSAAPGAVARLEAPDGVRSIDARERERVLRGLPGALVLDERALRVVRPDGEMVSFARRRMLLPLLRALSAGEPVPIEALAKALWARRDASARAAAKMSISRLRSLLGPTGDSLRAFGAGVRLSYGFEPPVPLLVLSPLTGG
jgi:tetratricopeptide (TPR) repeat protein